MSEVCAHRLSALLRVGEGNPDVVDARQRLGREHAHHDSLELVRLADRGHVDKNISGQIIQQMCKHQPEKYD